MTVTLYFHGASGTVTGSCYRVVHPKGQFLVDCGMFQGSRSLERLNVEDFEFDPRHVDAVVLTHAHIDHSGMLPKLVKMGFSGPIWCTQATSDLLEYMLADSARIQEYEAERRNRRRDRVKLLFFDRSGFVLVLKRLSEDKFCWPRREAAVARLTTEQLHLSTPE